MTGWIRLARLIGWSLAGLVAVAALLALGIRFLLLPALSQHPEAVAAAASRLTGESVVIDGVKAHWDGQRPQIELSGVRLFTRPGQPALELATITVTLAWRSLLQVRLAPAALESWWPLTCPCAGITRAGCSSPAWS